MQEPNPLDFHRANTLYATHGLHAFAAKFPPQLAVWAIQKYSDPAGVICDPMAGSGTTLVEAWRHGRMAYGFDIDPLACLISRAKSTPIAADRLRLHNQVLLDTIEQLRTNHAATLAVGTIPSEWQQAFPLPDLPNRDRWFLSDVQAALSLLKAAIRAADAPPDVNTLWHALFSSLIVAKTSVANARDLVHSRHHFRAHTTPPDVLKLFRRRLMQAEKQMRDLMTHKATPSDPPLPQMQCADSRHIPLPDASVNLVVTSPPYCNALDYVRAHKFGVAWLTDVLDVEIQDYVQRGRDYLGSERSRTDKISVPLGVAAADRISTEIHAIDPERGKLVARYFADMAQVLKEIGRILHPGGTAVLVVCPSNIRKIPILWHEAFAAMAEQMPAQCRMQAIETLQRTLDDGRRMLPYMNAGAQLAGRMRTEYVLVLQKPPNG